MTSPEECARIRAEAEDRLRLWSYTNPSTIKRRKCKPCNGSGMDGLTLCPKCTGTGKKPPKKVPSKLKPNHPGTTGTPDVLAADLDLARRAADMRNRAELNEYRLRVLRLWKLIDDQ